MRHIRIKGQNLKKLASFKDQISDILKELNKFDENDKNEAMSYLRNCVSSSDQMDQPSCSSSQKTESHKHNLRKRIRKVCERSHKSNSIIKKKYSSNLLKGRKFERSSKKLRFVNSNTVSSKKITYKCSVCNVTEKSKKNILKHMETHVGAPLSCFKCRRTFNGSVSFKWHLTHYCKPAFYENWKFKCNQCSREFVSKNTLESHLRGHKRNNCSYCDKVLTHRVQLIRHLLDVHSIKLERDTFKCEFCEKRYIKKCSLYYHLRQHFPDKIVCLECGLVSEFAEDYEEHKRQHDLQKHFCCSKCNERFSRRQQYLNHIKRHNRYKCLTCNESYASREKVTKHKQQGHKVEGLNPRFICPHCPLAFHRESRFHIHMRKHTDENRNVNCKYCKKTFNSPYAYYKHCITINHEKFSPEVSDIACTKCGKHFAKRFDLRQHMYRVHNITKELVSCQFCDYKTIHKCNMERHVALHFRKSNQFTCEYCGRSCDSIANLKDHIAYNHIQEKQFKCSKCDKSFKRNSELIRHQGTHSDERPHACTLCEKTYKRLNHLKRHEVRAHNVVKETRRVKQVHDEKGTKKQSEVKTEEAKTSNVVVLQPPLNTTIKDSHDNVLISFNNTEICNSGNLEQLCWSIDNDDFLYNVYNDVPLNYHQSLSVNEESDGFPHVNNADCGHLE